MHVYNRFTKRIVNFAQTICGYCSTKWNFSNNGIIFDLQSRRFVYIIHVYSDGEKSELDGGFIIYLVTDRNYLEVWSFSLKT